jgi:hypothetical protein
MLKNKKLLENQKIKFEIKIFREKSQKSRKIIKKFFFNF